jgi:hypothetical protein
MHLDKKVEIRCYICNSPALETIEPADRSTKDSVYSVDCPRCHYYRIESSGKKYQPSQDRRETSKVSSWIREHQSPLILIDQNWPFNLPEIRDPSWGEKAMKLLDHLAWLNPIPGQQFELPSWDEVRKVLEDIEKGNIKSFTGKRMGSMADILVLISISWIIDWNEYKFIVFHYIKDEQNWIEGSLSDGFFITPKGWAYLEESKYSYTESYNVFIAMSFEPEMDHLFNDILYKTVLSLGYIPIRVDKEHYDNLIDDEIIAGIKQSTAVIADFTGQKGGVYFETGFAQGMNIPVIRLCRVDDFNNLHFDVSHYPVIKWYPDKLDLLRKELENRVIGLIGKGNYHPHRTDSDEME